MWQNSGKDAFMCLVKITRGNRNYMRQILPGLRLLLSAPPEVAPHKAAGGRAGKMSCNKVNANLVHEWNIALICEEVSEPERLFTVLTCLAERVNCTGHIVGSHLFSASTRSAQGQRRVTHIDSDSLLTALLLMPVAPLSPKVSLNSEK